MKKCEACRKPMEHKEGTYRGHWICTNYPNCVNAVDESEGIEEKLSRKNSMTGMLDETFGDHREEDLKNSNI